MINNGKLIVIAATLLLAGCKTKEKATTETPVATELSTDDNKLDPKLYEGGRSCFSDYLRYPDNQLKFPAKGGTLVCKADTTSSSMSFYIASIYFDGYECCLTDGRYYYNYPEKEFDCFSGKPYREMRGYPAHWEPCPLTFNWVTVFLNGFDLEVTVEPNDTDKKRHCTVIVADENDFWQVECTQAKGPYKSKKRKKQAQ